MNENVREIQKAAIAGMLWNIILGVFKIAAGWLGNSRAVLADGVHSLSDIATDVAVFVGAKYWESPADRTHPHGHRRIETLVALFISLVLFAVAGGIFYEAVKSFINPSPKIPGVIALAAALVSIIIKEILYKWTVRRGKKLKSSALTANAWHHRSDAMSSMPAALAVGVALIFPDFYFVDAIGAVVVTLFILNAAWKTAKSALWELSDAAASQEKCDEICRIAAGTGGVMTVHNCRTRRMGPGIEVDIHIQVNPEISVREGHDIAGAVKNNLFEKGRDIADVIVHTEPYEEQGNKNKEEIP